MLVTKALPQDVAFLAFVPSLRRHAIPPGVAPPFQSILKIIRFLIRIFTLFYEISTSARPIFEYLIRLISYCLHVISAGFSGLRLQRLRG